MSVAVVFVCFLVSFVWFVCGLPLVFFVVSACCCCSLLAVSCCLSLCVVVSECRLFVVGFGWIPFWVSCLWMCVVVSGCCLWLVSVLGFGLMKCACCFVVGAPSYDLLLGVGWCLLLVCCCCLCCCVCGLCARGLCVVVCWS